MSFPPALQRVGPPALAYLLARQCPSGGFCFYRTAHLNESNLSDTHHALAALALLGYGIPQRAQVRAFAAAFEPGEQPDALFHLAGIARLIDPGRALPAALSHAIGALTLAAPQREVLTAWLARACVVVRARQLAGLAPEPWLSDAVQRLVGEDGGVGLTPNLVDTAAVVELLDTRAVRPLPSALAAFVDSLQRPAIGFTMTPASQMSRLELVAAGVRACRAFRPECARVCAGLPGCTRRLRECAERVTRHRPDPCGAARTGGVAPSGETDSR
jgi:hypothetical protein